MKVGVRSVVLLAAFVSAISACTVNTSGGGSDAGGSSPNTPAKGGAEGDGGSGEGGSADASGTTSTVPAELVGPSWTWTTTGGAHRLSFTADGGYTSDVFLDGHPGDSCGTEYFTRREGKATFDETTLTLTPATAMRTKKNSCSGDVLGEEAIAKDVSVYRYRLDDTDNAGPALVLTSSDGTESSFYRD